MSVITARSPLAGFEMSIICNQRSHVHEYTVDVQRAVFSHIDDHCAVSGVPCPARGDAGDHQAAGGGPVSCPTPQRPLRIRT